MLPTAVEAALFFVTAGDRGLTVTVSASKINWNHVQSLVLVLIIFSRTAGQAETSCSQRHQEDQRKG